MTPEATQELARLRSKYLAEPDSLTMDELRRATQLLREARGQMAMASKAKAAAKSPTKAPVDLDALNNELDGL